MQASELNICLGNLQSSKWIRWRSYTHTNCPVSSRTQKTLIYEHTFLTNMLRISRTTLFRASQSSETNPQARERRGLYPTRKTDARSIQNVKDFIKKFPTFESNRDYKYLHPRLTVKKMNKIYVNELNSNGDKPVSVHIFRRIFKKDFNLRFAKRKNRCNTCHHFEMPASSMVLRDKMKKRIEAKKKKHINEVIRVKMNFVNFVKEAMKFIRSPCRNLQFRLLLI